jgi:5'-nucleotidase
MNAANAQEFHLKIVALNDFHGNLQSPGKSRANAQSPEVPVGGADFLAAYVQRLKSGNPYTVVVSAGDVIGASPLVSALFHEEDTIEAMNRVGLEISSVGNHEFDKGRQELLRMQHGGCSTLDKNTCMGAAVGTPVPFEGARFQYLSANVFDISTGKTLFPAYAIRTYDGVKVAFIGLTLADTPTIVVPSGVAGLRFTDEASTINELVAQLRKQGIESFVVLIHQGGLHKASGVVDINGCAGGLRGSPIETIVHKLDDSVGLVISGHTHQAYICRIANRSGRMVPVTSASAFGRMVTDIDVTIDTRTRKIAGVTARNVLVDRTAADIVPDAALTKIVDRYAALIAPITSRVVGSVAADMVKKGDADGESPLGDLIADAQLEATRAPGSGAAVAAFMNSGGIRADIPFASPTAGVANGKVTYGELYTTQPFGNDLVTMTLTGAQIKTMLEEQFKGCGLDAQPGDDPSAATVRTLQVSRGFTYAWNPTGAPCHRVDAASIKIEGVPVVPAAKYRITVNSLLADGGDQFYVLRKGTDRLVGEVDLEALTAYFAKHPSLAPPPGGRVSVRP